MRCLIFGVLLFFFFVSVSACVKHLDCKGAISSAEQMIAKARSEEASTYALDYLELSEKELARALKESQSGNSQRALGFAKRSESDAETAMLLSRYRKFKVEKERLLQQLGEE